MLWQHEISCQVDDYDRHEIGKPLDKTMLDQGIIPGILTAFEDNFDETDHKSFRDPV